MTRKVLAVCVVLFGLMGLAAADPPGPIEVAYRNTASKYFDTIQDAIDDPCTVTGDEVIVGPKWADPEVPEIYYVPNIVGNRDIDFHGKAITVRSRYGPAYCIINCEGLGRAFSFHSGEFYNRHFVTGVETGSILKGFRIKNGLKNFGGAIECIANSAPMIRDCIFTDNRAHSYGGAIECYAASPRIFNCLFYNNSAGGYGGAIDCEGIEDEAAKPKIINCTFDNNRADIAGGKGGGGVFSSWNSLPLVQDSIFTNNNSHALCEYASNTQGDVEVRNCLFFENYIVAGDENSPFADYYDADTQKTYWGKLGPDGLNSIPNDPVSGDLINAIYDTDPLFVRGPLSDVLVPGLLGNYYLSQVEAGQADNSPCWNKGSIWYSWPFPLFPLDTDDPNTPIYTTRTDNKQDEEAVDLGYHYRQIVLEQGYDLVTKVETVNGAEGTIDPNHPLGYYYEKFSIVGLTADPNEDSVVSWWGGGTEYDGPTDPCKNMPQGRTYNTIEIIEDNVVPGTDEIRVTVEFDKRPRHWLKVTPGEGGQREVDTTEQIAEKENLFCFYKWKTVVVDAIPNDGYVVKRWTGLNLNPLDPERDATTLDMTRAWITMHDDREDVGVEFITDYVELTVLYNLEGGEVYPRRGRYPYPGPGVDPCEVTLTAYPNTNTDPSYRLESWFGTDDDNSTALINSVTMNEDKTVEVLFATVPNHWLTIDIEPDSQGHDNGTVQMLPSQPDNGYSEGTQVQLLPHAENGYAAEWLSGFDSFDPNGAWVTIMGPTTVSVKFVRTNLPDGSRICVYAPGPDGEPDWAAGPKGCYPTIQDAIDAADTGIYGPWVIVGDLDATPLPIFDLPESPGDIVVVGDGVYTGPGNWDLNFYGKLITVRSEFGPENCIIDCGGTPGDPHRAFLFSDMENNGAVVDGFTIRGGYVDFGGAIAIGGISRPLINNCIIWDNHAVTVGGGVYFEGLAEDDTTYEDWAAEADAIATELEAALTDTGEDPNGNPLPPSLDDIVDAIVARMMAIFAQQILDSIDDEEADRPTLNNCKVSWNKVGEAGLGDGGGIFCLETNPIIINTEISYNEAGISHSGELAYGSGGGAYCYGSVADFINCLVIGNMSSGPGGGIYLAWASDAIITLCTVTENHSNAPDPESATGETSDGIIWIESAPTISYCIVHQPWGVDVTDVAATENCWIEDENLFQLPMFVTKTGYGEYYLSQPPGQALTSPAVDATDAEDILNGPEGLFATYELLPVNITTNIENNWDYSPTDYGYHYPFTPSITYTLILHVEGNGNLKYTPPGSVDPCTVTPAADGYYVAAPGTSVFLTADPCEGYRVYEWTGTDVEPSFASTNNITMYTENVVYDIWGNGYIYVTLKFEEAFASSIHVPADYAYNEIQNAIDAARDGDTLVLAPGTYPGTGYLVWGKNITITAEFPTERDNPAMATIIDCSGEVDGGFHLIGDGTGSCILNGIVIIQTNIFVRGGDGFNGDDIEDGIAGTPGRPGGTLDPGGLPLLFPSGAIGFGVHYESILPACGISVYGNHTVANCTVRGFTIRGGNGGDGQAGDEDIPFGGYGGDGGSSNGAGIFVGRQYYEGCPWTYRSSPLVKDCIVENCTVIAGNGGNGAEGGYDFSDGGRGGVAGAAQGAGIYCESNTSPTFKNCVVQNCQAIGGYGGNGGDSGPDGGWGGYGGLTIYDPCQPHPSSRTARGAGAYCESDSSAIFIDCVFEDNFADGSVSGLGGIDVLGNYQSQPRNNYKIPGYGAGVFCEGNSETTFTKNCIIRNNESTFGYGAGIPVAWADPTIVPELVEFGGTEYTGYGGGVCVEDIIYYYNLLGPPVITATPSGLKWSQTFTFWSEVDRAIATFTDCQITKNSAPIGGGIYSKGSEVDITGCDFIENSSYLGGGLLSTHGLANISASTIRDNIASVRAGFQEPEPGPAPEPGEEPEEVEAIGQLGIGGGIFYFTTDGVISDTVITGNFADVSGGGVYLGGEPGTLTRWNMAATPELNNCLITNNTTGQSGGGVACNISVQAQIRNCTIANNLATDPNSYGGGIYCTYRSIVDVNDSILWANNADYGAQLAVDGFWIDENDTNIETYFSKVNIRYSNIANGKPVDISSSSSAGSLAQTGGPFLVEPETIYGQFDAGQSTVEVIVSLVEPQIRQTLNWNVPEEEDALRAEIYIRQDTVLNTLTLAEFAVRHIFENQAGFSGEVTLDGLNKLLADPLVHAIEPIRYVRPALRQAIPLANALMVRQSYDGTGISIAIVDSGVDYTHPMLGGGTFPNAKVIGGYDFGENDADPMPSDPIPPYEAHGTACAGIAAGDLGTVGDYIGGVAPGAKIYALRLSSDAGLWPTDWGLAAWDWCITHRNDNPANPIKVISNSWGNFTFYDDPAVAEAEFPALAAAANNATAAGITLLAASGNEFSTTGIIMPAAFSNVISVGAVYDTTGQVTEYSNTASILDILAPADPVYTTDVVGTGGAYDGDYWPDFNGTSSATPFAAGAVASLQSAAMAKMGYYLVPAKVRDILVATGNPVTDTKVNITKPLINLGAAISTLSYGSPVWVTDGCRLNGRLFEDFDPDIFAWDPAAHNIEDDPNFVGDYFLSQILAGQFVDSNCVDAGSDLAENLGMDQYTTRTDGVGDDGIVDMGYHHPLVREGAGVLELCSYADLFPIPSLGEGRDYGDGIVDMDYIFVLASYWLDDCPYGPECEYADITLDGFVNIEDFGYFVGRCWLGEYSQDNVGPEPDPSTWETVPSADSSTSITMTATTASDRWGWRIQYYFEEISGNAGGTDSGWQWDPYYRDPGLTSGQEYTYRVRTRDKSPYENVSGWSDPGSATPVTDNMPPLPDPMTWATMPYSTSASTIAMTATTAVDPEPSSTVYYYFEETTGNAGATDSGWQLGTSYTDIGLTASTLYRYRVRAQDSALPPNITDWSTTEDATTDQQGGNLPPYPIGGNVGDPAQWDPVIIGASTGHPRERFDPDTGNYYHAMRATEAVDAEGEYGVQYYFECVTTGHTQNSGWQDPALIGVTAREWEVQAPEGTTYCYRVKYRDKSPQFVESAPTADTCVVP